MCFCILRRNSRWPPKRLGKKSPDDSADTLGVKNLIVLALSRTVSEKKTFLHFTQKFKFAAKNDGKTTFGKNRQMILRIPWGQKFRQNCSILQHFSDMCTLRRKSRWTPKMTGKLFLGKVTSSLYKYPRDQKFCRNRSTLHHFEINVFCI